MNDWNANGVDQTLQSAYAQLSPDQLQSANIDLQGVLNNINIYNPSVTIDNIRAVLARCDAQPPNFRQGVINGLNQSGMASYISSGINLAGKFAALGNSSNAAIAQFPRGMQPARLPPNGPPDGGGGGYSCAADGMMIAAVGLAFLTIAIMSAGTAPILMGAAWGGIAAWGGGVTTAYGIGHNMKCGF